MECKKVRYSSARRRVQVNVDIGQGKTRAFTHCQHHFLADSLE